MDNNLKSMLFFAFIVNNSPIELSENFMSSDVTPTNQAIAI